MLIKVHRCIQDQGCVTHCWYLCCFQRLSVVSLHYVPSKRSGSVFLGQPSTAVIIFARLAFLRTWHSGVLFDCIAGLLVKKTPHSFHLRCVEKCIVRSVCGTCADIKECKNLLHRYVRFVSFCMGKAPRA